MRNIPSERISAGPSRRVFLFAPVALGGLWWLIRSPARSLPDPKADGSGNSVTLMLVDDNGHLLGPQTFRKFVKTDAQWRAELSQDAFAVTRRGATEFAFANPLWKEHRAGLYRCVCCGTALFRSQDKFDSGTGWPSFIAPVSKQNIIVREDRSIAETRQEVLCRKCDAHLGHVFNDGPPPSGLRYCLNSPAITFLKYQDDA